LCAKGRIGGDGVDAELAAVGAFVEARRSEVFGVTKWVSGTQGPMISHDQNGHTAWHWGAVLRGLLMLVGATLLLVAMSLAGSGSVVLAASR
jgi:hypothetical protein